LRAPASVAVKVTLCPWVEGLGRAVRVVVVVVTRVLTTD
jgi:hypothetical protein